MSSLEGKVAIVTGGASGIGRATAELFAERGAAVVVADIDAEGAEALATEIGGRGGKALALAVDLAEEEQIRSLVDRTVEAFGTLHILHNNAAFTGEEAARRDVTLESIDGEFFGKVLKINVVGPALAAKYAVPHMIDGGGGVIVNTGSVSGMQGRPVRPAYGASKAALTQLTRDLAGAYGRFGIRSVGVAPGFVLTPSAERIFTDEQLEGVLDQYLVANVCRPLDVANVVAFLASDEAAYVSGTVVPVDGGYTSHCPDYRREIELGEQWAAAAQA